MQMYTALQVNYSERRDNGTVEEGGGTGKRSAGCP